RAVRVVATSQGSSDIDNHWVAGIDDAIGEAVVRVGTVFHRTDDDKVDADVLFENQSLKIVCYLALGAASLQKLRHLTVHALNGLCCLAQFIDLPCIL